MAKSDQQQFIRHICSHAGPRRATQGCAQRRVSCKGHGEGRREWGRGGLPAKTVQATKHGSGGPGEQWENRAKEKDAQGENRVWKKDRSRPDSRQVYLKPTTPLPVVSLIFKTTGSTRRSPSCENRTCVPVDFSPGPLGCGSADPGTGRGRRCLALRRSTASAGAPRTQPWC